MVKKAIKIIVFVHFVSIVIQSCALDDYVNSKWTDFVLQVIDISDSENGIPFIDEGDVVNKNSFGFWISMKFEGEKARRKDWGVGITECKADLGIARLNSMCSIIIKTVNNYSGAFPSGSDITSLFKVGMIYGSSDEGITSIDELVNSTKKHDYESYMFELHLIDDTCTGGLQKFEITIILSDDKVLVHETDELLME